MSFDRFEFTDDTHTMLRCKDCGTEVERGIVNISNHWTSCGGKEFFNSIMDMAETNKGKLTQGNVNYLLDKLKR